MKITKTQIQKIIREEISRVQESSNFPPSRNVADVLDWLDTPRQGGEDQSPRQVFFKVILPALEAAGYTGLDAMKMARDAVDAAFEAGAEMMGPREGK